MFRLTPDGNETVIHSFASSEGRPYGGLTLGLDGFLYGVTLGGGSTGYGTVYKVSTDGTTFEIVHSFNGGTEGTPWYGNGAPVHSTDGNFYGSVSDGNSNYGTIYNITPAGSMKVLFTRNCRRCLALWRRDNELCR